MKAVVLGATKGMGRAVARQLAERGHALFLLGRDAADLATSARAGPGKKKALLGLGLGRLDVLGSFAGRLRAHGRKAIALFSPED